MEKQNLLLLRGDSSERTKMKFQKLCDENKIPYCIAGKIEEISKAIGKTNKAIIGIKEENIAKQIQKINHGGEDIG